MNFHRECNCKPQALNCLAAKEWLKCQLGVWTFKYDSTDMRDKTKHPATFPVSLPAKIIELMTHKGELVVDPFVGSGSTLLACNQLMRNCVGFDINPKYVELASGRIPPPSMYSQAKQVVVCADSMDAKDHLSPETVKLVMTSPPYSDQLNRKRKAKSNRGDRNSRAALARIGKVEQYSQDPRDLGTMGFRAFSTRMTEMFSRMLPLMTADGQCVINIGDMYVDGTSIPLHIHVINAIEAAGFEYRNTIIWDKLRMIQKTGIFGYPSNFITIGGSFEYILHFRVPKKVRKPFETNQAT